MVEQNPPVIKCQNIKRGRPTAATIGAIRQREADIVQLKVEGLSITQIAKRYELSQGRITRIYRKALSRAGEPYVKEERARAVMVYDRAVSKLWAIEATDPDNEIRIKAILAVLRWEEWRMNMLGFAMPVKLSKTLREMEQAGGLNDDQARMIRELMFGKSGWQPHIDAETIDISNAKVLNGDSH